MVSKTFSLLFYFKKKKVSGKIIKNIYARITIDGKRVDLSVRRQWDPSRWNSANGCATGTREDAKILNAHLTSFRNQVYEIYEEIFKSGETITVEKIKNKLVGEIERPRMLLEIFQEHNNQIKPW